MFLFQRKIIVRLICRIFFVFATILPPFESSFSDRAPPLNGRRGIESYNSYRKKS